MYDTALQRLSLQEQSEFHVYHHLMTPGQVHTYLAKATAAERTVYLGELGLTQRFQALDPLDRDAILSGTPRQGMAAEALRFMWGEPYYTTGSRRHDEHWYYLGSSFGLAATGNQYGRIGTQVDVYLVHGQVVAWVDFAPSTDEDAGDTFRR
jgi:hypothetical protein